MYELEGGRGLAGWDIEITTDIPEGEDWQKFRPLGISCASVVYTEFAAFQDAAVVTWWGGKSQAKFNERMSQEEVQQMVLELQELSNQGYIITTWNGLSFDFNVLAEESGMHDVVKNLALSHWDMMFQFYCMKGYPVGLNAVSKAIPGLGGKLEGISGKEAPALWRNGNNLEVLEYNIQDSKLTLQIGLFVHRFGNIPWIARSGRRNGLPLPDGWLNVEECLGLELPDQSWMDTPLEKSQFTGWLDQ